MADNSAQNGTDTIATDDVTTLNGGASSGVKVQRVKVMHGADGTATDASAADPLPVIQVDSNRTIVHFWATGVASGTTGTETAITLTRSTSPGSATASGASYAPTSGKRLRISQVVFAARGNATATAQVTTFTLRVNTAGAVTTTSNTWMAARVATPATALAWDRFVLSPGDLGPSIAGDGTLQIGVTANAVFTTNAPTWDVLITAYEF